MKISDHPYTNSDAEHDAIKDFLLKIVTFPDFDDNWDASRQDWWRYSIHPEKELDFFKANAHYWKTETGQVVGLFISEYGRDDFFVVAHPDYPGLFSKVLNWGVEVWSQGKKKITTPVFSFDQHKVEQLLAAGFYEDGQENNVRTYALEQYDFSYTLKPGFEILTFSEYGNYDSRIKLVQNAFNNPAYTEARLRSLQSSPGYHADLDLVVVNAQGESVAYCMGWVEEYDPSAGYIEPMGTHSEYRRHGFATCLAKECFKRLWRKGVKKVTIASHAEPNISNFLYESLNPVSVKKGFNYSLDLESE